MKPGKLFVLTSALAGILTTSLPISHAQGQKPGRIIIGCAGDQAGTEIREEPFDGVLGAWRPILRHRGDVTE